MYKYTRILFAQYVHNTDVLLTNALGTRAGASTSPRQWWTDPMGNVDLKQEQRNIQTWGREYIQVDLEQSHLVFSEQKIMHLYWLHVYTTVFFTQRTVALSSCLIFWSWSMVHRGKKLLSNRSADVFGMLLFLHQYVAASSSRTSIWAPELSGWGCEKQELSKRFFQLGKKVPEKMMGLLRMQPELKVYRTDWFHWLECLKTHGIFVLGHCGEVRGVPIRWRLFAVWWAQNLAFQQFSTWHWTDL